MATATISGTKKRAMKKSDLPYDIVLLQRRLDLVVEREEYERAAIIKRWIDELMIFYRVGEKRLDKKKR